ncbi:ComEC/Rec2 family competence protein [uncultured Pseudacidovorax sp.]|uniref:ComEC/Rec2 family competence protein n=1 Tax=uncultured Pseudacidovorax sp. TaxID=679313 RepID=UPI0025D66914|nr:ComEC/Rec2 family competence protein [uncultured Pseudacidovorax sp.]
MTRAWRGAGWGGVLAALAGSVAGVALQLQQAALWPAGIYAASLIAGLLLWPCAGLAAGRHRMPGLVLAMLAGLLLGAGQTGARAGLRAHDALVPALEGREIVVEGRIDRMPQHRDGGLRFAFDLDGAAGLPGRAMLFWPEAVPAAEAPHAGERWRLAVRLRAPHGNLNPHGFDYELWLYEQDIQATGTVRAAPAPERLARPDFWALPLERASEWVRDRILARTDGSSAGRVVAALVTGDQSAIAPADWEVFRATGVAHLMSISGLHVTMFAWLAAAVVGRLWRLSPRLMLRWPAPHAGLVGGLLLAALYAGFSGWGLPSQRTVWMLAVAVLLRLSARRWPWPVAWLVVLALVVALDPWGLLQAGFWLSFVAVAALFATDAGPLAGGAANRRSGAVRRLLREQMVVTLALAPLGLLLFQQVSLVGLAANLLAIPVVTLVVTPLGMLGIVLPPAWDVAAFVVEALRGGLAWAAQMPGATFSAAAPPLWAAAAGVAGGALMGAPGPLAWRLMGLPLLLPVLLWRAEPVAAGEFEVLAADVGQGGAVIVRTAGHVLLFDAGPRYGARADAGTRVLVPLLRAQGLRLDRLLLSHRDADHTGGAAAVRAAHPAVGEAGPPCARGLRWQWDGVDFEVLHPAPEDARPLAPHNATSCVLRIGNGRASALLTGDIEQPQELQLVADHGEALRADLLLVAHHGSRSSSAEPWLRAVRPAVAVAQNGWRNPFGHPAPEVRARFRRLGIPLHESAVCGAAQWRSRAPAALVCERQAAARYWHHRPSPPAGEE